MPNDNSTQINYYDTPTNFYYGTNAGTNRIEFIPTNAISVDGLLQWSNQYATATIEVTTKKDGIHPLLYFKYVKSKFKILERMRLDRRLKYLEQAFYRTAEAGQVALSEKIIKMIGIETRESMMYAKGIRQFIERDDIERYRRKIRDGHISDTLFKDFTRVIPKKIIEKKKKLEMVFDDFVIYHYWNDKAEKNRESKQRITPEEKSKLRDPVLFGIIKETNRLYFIDEWDDDFCDLSFSEMVDVIGKDDEEFELKAKPTLDTLIVDFSK